MEINFDKDYLRQLNCTRKGKRRTRNIVSSRISWHATSYASKCWNKQEAWKSFTSSTRFIMKC